MLQREISVRIALHVSPGAAKNELLGFKEETLWLKVAAVPRKGEANREVVSFLSRRLGVAKSNLQIVKGYTSRDKVISISGLNQEEVMKRLSSSCGDE